VAKKKPLEFRKMKSNNHPPGWLTLAHLETKYGGVESYLKTAELSAKEIGVLRQRLLAD
jgi:hypothetical protein